MLQIKNLEITLRKDLRTIFSGFNFVLNPGDKAVIIGEEGNGKSTLLKLIYDPGLIESYAEYSGEIITMGAKLGYLGQELDGEMKALTAYEYFSSLPGFFDADPGELARLTREVALPKDIFYSDQVIGTMSGGERVKLRMLGLLIEKPDVLLLDEPTNDVDIDTLRWLENLIKDAPIPVLYVSHDETLIENTANVIIHIEQVRRKTVSRYTVSKCGYRDYISSRAAALSHQEQVARKESAEAAARQERLRKIEQQVRSGLNSVSRADPHSGQLMKKKMKAVKSLEKRFQREDGEMTQIPDVEEAIFLKFAPDITVPNGKTIVDIKIPELTAGDRVIARDIALNVTGPEKVCITGRNGQGKTTLLRTIAGGLMERKDIKCGYMPQNYEELLDFSKTPVEFLSVSFEKEDMTRARTFLGSVKYTADEMEHGIDMLSGGQKAKLLFLKMILDGCNVLVLDEPTRNFSPMSNPVIRGVLREFGGAVISVSHDRKFISEVSDKVYGLYEDGLKLLKEEDYI